MAVTVVIESGTIIVAAAGVTVLVMVAVAVLLGEVEPDERLNTTVP